MTEKDEMESVLSVYQFDCYTDANGQTHPKVYGEGSGGVIYKAYHQRLGKWVVFKEIKNASMDLESNRKEVDILKSLRHEALPGVLDFLEIDGRFFTVMDYIQGIDLAKFLSRGNRLSQKQLVAWMVKLADALALLHGSCPPIIHCDIKPDNIMISKNGKVHLIDFNVSTFQGSTGMLGYSHGFAAPELKQAIDKKLPVTKLHQVISGQVDIYSLGAVMYYCITGKTFEAKHPHWEEVESRVSPALFYLLQSMLYPDPRKRISSMEEVKRSLMSLNSSDKRFEDLKNRYTRNVIIYTSCLILCLCGVFASLFLLNERKQKQKEALSQAVVQSETIQLVSDSFHTCPAFWSQDGRSSLESEEKE